VPELRLNRNRNTGTSSRRDNADAGGVPEVTGNDGETVFRCRKGDAGDLAATISRALANPELRAAVGAAGRQRVIERWTWERCAELTVEQYREVLAMPANVEKAHRNRTSRP
jgi:hypothetical protein